MIERTGLQIAIVNYGMGNLFSVKNACEHVGMQANITSSGPEILRAGAVILPGVGAFGDAIESLRRFDLISPLMEMAQSSRPFVGICLGMQLLMTESHEFGRHRGLGIIEGPVESLSNISEPYGNSKDSVFRRLKIPHVGWAGIFRKKASQSTTDHDASAQDAWLHTPLAGLRSGAFMYFTHSFYVKPVNSDVVLSISRYGEVEFCSSFIRRNIFACQFHPERSGPEGLQIYRQIASLMRKEKEGCETNG